MNTWLSENWTIFYPRRYWRWNWYDHAYAWGWLAIKPQQDLHAHGVDGDKSADYYDTNNQTNYLTSHFNYSFRLMATEPAC